MPHIVIHLSGEPVPALAEAASHLVASLTQEVLVKDPAVMSIGVVFIPAECWFVGGKSLAAQMRSAYHVDISVTDETNTKAQKARYLKAIHEGFARLLPDLHEVSYVHVIDARAAAYGYGGRTQEARHQAAGV